MLFQTIVSEYAVVTCYTHPSRVQKSRKTERKSVQHETLHYTGRKSVIKSIIQVGKGVICTNHYIGRKVLYIACTWLPTLFPGSTGLGPALKSTLLTFYRPESVSQKKLRRS